MKTKKLFSTAAASMLVLASQAMSQAKEFGPEASFAERNLGGPRLGVTYILGNPEFVGKLRDRGIGNTISQFGWHFEYQILPEGGGPSFVIQAIPMVGGVEYGTLIPTGTFAMGVRLPDGFEFGMGPNIMLGGPRAVNTALLIAVGKSFNYGGVSIPVNLVYATNPDGNRVSVVFGYAIAKITN